MTIVLATARPDHTAGEVERIVSGFRQHRNEIDAVLICDDDALLADLPMFDLVAYPDDELISTVLAAEHHHGPLTVTPDAAVAEVADQLVRTRRFSLLVVDEDGHPSGASWPTTYSTRCCPNADACTPNGCCNYQ